MISQGGYYQYDFGLQEAYRDPLQHMLPLVYADPGLALDVIRYSAQPAGARASHDPLRAGAVLQGRSPARAPPSDLDLWLLLSASEYGLATARPRAFFDERLPFAGGGAGSLWRAPQGRRSPTRRASSGPTAAT